MELRVILERCQRSAQLVIAAHYRPTAPRLHQPLNLHHQVFFADATPESAHGLRQISFSSTLSATRVNLTQVQLNYARCRVFRRAPDSRRPRLWRNSSWRQIQPGVQTMYEPAPEVTADLLAAADELDALETGLVADVELHPEASATH
jgi:hypothetical protein